MNSVLGIVTLLGAVLIVLSARGDLWLDEVWSVNLAAAAPSAADIFLEIHHDNNHPLNTLYLHVVGSTAPLFVYRLLSVLSGIGALIVFGVTVRRRWGYAQALLTVLLIGTSFPVILYLSEARGYAPAIFMAALGYAILDRARVRPRPGMILGFHIVCILGLLSHATFALVMAGFVLMHVLVIREEGALRAGAGRLLMFHGIPLVFLAGWYVYFYRSATLGGGPVHDLNRLAGDFGTLLGAPAVSFFPLVAVITIAVLLLAGVVTLFRDGRPEWGFFAGTLIGAPLLLVLTRPDYVYFRYFAVCFPFFYMLVAYAVCRAVSGAGPGLRVVIGVALLAVLAGQAVRVGSLLTVGRGGYSKALAFIAEQSSEPVVRIGTDHDFRSRLLVDFYAPRLRTEKEILYIEQSRWRNEPPGWLITQSKDHRYLPEPVFLLEPIGNYRLIADFPYAGLSGWRWFVYRRDSAVNS